jgi:mycothiol synthase
MNMVRRPYSGEQDLQPIIDLLLACGRAGYADMEFRSIELRFALRDPMFDRTNFTALFEDARGELVAFGILWRGRYLGMLVHPRFRGHLEGEVIRWAQDQVRASDQDASRRRLWVLCRDDDRLSTELFESTGFVLDDEELRMGRDLHEPIASSQSPNGFTIRPLAGEQEAEPWVALYLEAFQGMTHSQRWTTVRGRLDLMRDPDYDGSLDLVAEAPDGGLAAFCYCSIGSAEASTDRRREGRTEPIATREGYRGIGLGRAIVLTGLRCLRDRGMDVATLTKDVDNLPAQRLYELVGFHPLYRARWYVLDL